MANFGDQERGVYQKRFIQAAVEEGRLCKHKYIDLTSEEEIKAFNRMQKGPVVMAVDFDKIA